MRPPKEETWLHIAAEHAQQGTCARRACGCVLVDANGDAIGMGYNGPAAGQPHCIETPCPGATAAPGTGLDACEAIHAEANALLRCREPFAIDTAYVTASPCLGCVKLLLGTSCRRIVFIEPYAHDSEARQRWLNAAPSRLVPGPRAWIRWPGEFRTIQARSEMVNTVTAASITVTVTPPAICIHDLALNLCPACWHLGCVHGVPLDGRCQACNALRREHALIHGTARLRAAVDGALNNVLEGVCPHGRNYRDCPDCKD